MREVQMYWIGCTVATAISTRGFLSQDDVAQSRQYLTWYPIISVQRGQACYMRQTIRVKWSGTKLVLIPDGWGVEVSTRRPCGVASDLINDGCDRSCDVHQWSCFKITGEVRSMRMRRPIWGLWS